MKNEKTENIEHIEDSSPEAKARRFKAMRKMMGITCVDLARRLGYTRQTLFSWENPGIQGKGLSEKGAIRVSEVAKEKGVVCDFEWLLSGLGEIKYMPAIPAGDAKNKSARLAEARGWIQDTFNELEANLKFYKEIESFFLDHNTAVIMEISDSSLSPIYEKGDWVGAQLITVGAHLVGKICIVEINEVPQVRMVQAGDTEGTFNLSYLKKTSETKADFELKNVTIVNVAPVTRVWRR
jgi:DNA-binding XRE family transcriptional regulator